MTYFCRPSHISTGSVLYPGIRAVQLTALPCVLLEYLNFMTYVLSHHVNVYYTIQNHALRNPTYFKVKSLYLDSNLNAYHVHTHAQSNNILKCLHTK